MGLLVTATAQIRCTFGADPSVLGVLPAGVLCAGKPVATIQAIAPEVNVPSFGMCSSEANPEVSEATAAAEGVLTPMPCVPAVDGPWAPGSPTVSIAGVPALTQSSKCLCAWEGVITILVPGQQGTEVAG
jgi:Domain of unknown function (DUF4280)